MNLPKIAKARQILTHSALNHIPRNVRDAFSNLNLREKIKPGDRIAIAAGSRGIANITVMISEIISYLNGLGAHCYVAPAMGSHGGATAQGQMDILKKLGITQESVGAEIISNMETDLLGFGKFGQPIYCGRDFTRADHIVLINRIKPHTSFRGSVESGLFKLMTVGMGKRNGAEAAHKYFLTHGFDPIVLDTGNILLDKLPVLCGLAVVENSLDETAILKILAPENILIEEKRLINQARGLMPKLPFTNIDLLIVDEMGKNISGMGIDSNITGRILHQATPEPEVRQFKRIFVRDLTKESGGNALGIGAADFITKRLADKIDLEKTRINCITATAPEKGRIPFIYKVDRLAIEDGIETAGCTDSSEARIIWIKNTLELDCMWLSESLSDDLKLIPDIELLTNFLPMPFDDAGNLPFGYFRHKYQNRSALSSDSNA